MKSIKLIFLAVFQIIVSVVSANNSAEADSLLNELSKSNDTTKINILLTLSKDYHKSGNIVQAKEYCLKAIELAKNEKNKYFLASAYLVMGGRINNGTSNLNDALYYLLEAQKLADKINNPKLNYQISNCLGNTYWAEKNYDKALEFYKSTFYVAHSVADSYGESVAAIGLGNIYKAKGDYSKALKEFERAATGFKEASNENGYVIALGNIGEIYVLLNENDKAIEYLTRSFNIVEKTGNKYATGLILYSIGTAYFQAGDLKSAMLYLRKAVEIFKFTDDKLNLEESYRKMAQLFYQNGQSDSAYYYSEKASVIQDSIFSKRSSELIAEMQTKYETEKKEEENKRLLSEKELAEGKVKQQLRFVIGLVLFLITVLVFSFFLYRSNGQKQKKNLIISKQKEIAENQKVLLLEKNKEILDSINYAKRLQDAILPPIKELKKSLPNSFIIYKPKDIVAGDFYWSHLLKNEQVGTTSILLAAADCTGHGVPGAIMSMVCSNALNKVVSENQLKQPGEILDYTRILVAKTFVKEDVQTSVSDGMDISLARIQINNKENSQIEVEWAGANNPLWIIKRKAKNDDQISPDNEEHEFIELKGDKQPIGLVDNPFNFKTHKLFLQKGDMIFLFSDGLADQFGGPHGKKFKSKQLKDLICANMHLPIDNLKAEIETSLQNWKGELEQVDDILVIGLRL